MISTAAPGWRAYKPARDARRGRSVAETAANDEKGGSPRRGLGQPPSPRATRLSTCRVSFPLTGPNSTSVSSPPMLR
jgi:hypothetical protein